MLPVRVTVAHHRREELDGTRRAATLLSARSPQIANSSTRTSVYFPRVISWGLGRKILSGNVRLADLAHVDGRRYRRESPPLAGRRTLDAV